MLQKLEPKKLNNNSCLTLSKVKLVKDKTLTNYLGSVTNFVTNSACSYIISISRLFKRLKDKRTPLLFVTICLTGRF